jgi:tellurite resistance protein TerC
VGRDLGESMNIFSVDSVYFPYLVFVPFVLILFFIDLIATSRRHGPMTFKQSIFWTSFWVGMAGLFNVFVYYYFQHWHGSGHGSERALEFLTGYLIEQSLSVDNLFVFMVIFSFMKLGIDQQGIALKWGIFGAIIFRVIFVILGLGLLHLFEPVMLVFAVIIIYAAYKMAFSGDEEVHPEKNPVYRLANKFFPISYTSSGNRFFVKEFGRVHITPMMITILLILSMDIIFAVDSIPAIIAITQDPFIVISSNIFAVLGLQALFFAFSRLAELFYYLKHGVSVVLAWVGIKMLLAGFVFIPFLKDYAVKVPTVVSLIVVVSVLVISIVASLLFKKSQEKN